MTHADVQDWLDRYITAWRSNQADPIRDLFTDDVVYRWRPYESHPAAHGIEEVVEGWLVDTRDEPDSWDAHYQPYAVDGDRAVAVGFSHYRASAGEPDRTYHNAFLLRFAPDGRCAEFTECYMLEEPEA